MSEIVVTFPKENASNDLVVRLVEKDGLWRARVHFKLEWVTIELEVERSPYRWAAASMLSEVEIKTARIDVVRIRLALLVTDVRRAAHADNCPPEMIAEIRKLTTRWFGASESLQEAV